MIREIAFFAGIALFLVAIWMIKDESISKKAKTIITVGFFITGIFAYLYESEVSKKESKNALLLGAFNQGKTLVCADKKVDKMRFNYEFGTACFMPKREFAELNGVIVKISDCELASE
ncbi:hypothetical protein [Campylobacter suis]|uniref:Integral membrane protein n=1 Tax=Campylobacter suis TaxID=2790657 RepID=A0ABM8Q6X3_9BACT|nr:hypothetical protein [Campylobacter suis]CAD7288543.1 hypothetical protein LMG8286_01387 [Campylobacter suis]